MEDVKAKTKEISTEKVSLQKSLNDALLIENELDKEVSKFTDKAVSTSGVYFEHSREKVLFLYHTWIRAHEFLKVIREGVRNTRKGRGWIGFLDLENFCNPTTQTTKIMIKIRTQVFLSWFAVNEVISSSPS